MPLELYQRSEVGFGTRHQCHVCPHDLSDICNCYLIDIVKRMLLNIFALEDLIVQAQSEAVCGFTTSFH